MNVQDKNFKDIEGAASSIYQHLRSNDPGINSFVDD